MKPLMIVIFCLCTLLFGCKRYDDPAAIKKMIEAQDKIFAEAFNKSDVNGIMSVYWNSPDLIAMYPDGNYRGYDAVKQSWWNMFNTMDHIKFEFTESHIEVIDDVAVEWGFFKFSFQPKGGQVINAPGRYVEVWKKLNDAWVITVDHASSAIQPPTFTTELKK